MGTITLHINSDDTVKVSQSPEMSGVVASASTVNAIDGGAPKLEGNTPASATSSSADQLDIGGPPQWLIDALSKDKQGGDTPSSGDSSTDGGAPKA